MKKLIQIIFLLSSLAGMTGCATPYMVDRKRDAADIFTATVGVGAGVKARVGPFAQGVEFSMDYAGINGGDTFCGFGKYGDENGMDGAFIISGSELGNSSEISRLRNKYYKAFHILGVAYPGAPCGEVIYPASYFTQIDIVAGLGGTIKLGFNPGELLDFILGWATLDIYRDDVGVVGLTLERRRQLRDAYLRDKEKSNKPSDATR